jgi:Tol biopolymer transport system component
MKSLSSVFRLFLLLSFVALSTGLTGCFVSGWFGDDLPAIAYTVSNGTDAQVWVMETDADQPVRISSKNANARFPRWSPGQRFLAWVSQGTRNDLMVFDADTGDVNALVSGVEATQPPVWSPGSDRIAYVSDVEGEPDIYMVDLATGQKNTLDFQPGPGTSR